MRYYTVWEAFTELSDNLRESTTILLTSSSTTLTRTFFTTHNSTSPVTRTTTSHTHPHINGYQYTNHLLQQHFQLQSIHLNKNAHNQFDHHLHLHFPIHHLNQMITILKHKQTHKICSHHHPEETNANTGYIRFHQHQTQMLQEIYTPIQTDPVQPPTTLHHQF